MLTGIFLDHLITKTLVFSLDAFGDNSNYSCHLFEPKKIMTYVKEIVEVATQLLQDYIDI